MTVPSLDPTLLNEVSCLTQRWTAAEVASACAEVTGWRLEPAEEAKA